ncbi:MAG: DUF1294 domain-containing protein [Clostridium sp.]|jgi:uncharacterized membrane protein YsdA (DUF1294 family)|nr:DUF1294 domain-containing protein [Clostridium sp.]
MIYFWIYVAFINLLALILTVRDKNAAKRDYWRIKERTLIFVAILGGSIAMMVTMKLIRHKTRHVKFMVGIPFIIVLQAAVVGLLVWKGILLFQW